MVLIFAKNLTSSFPFCFNIFLLLLYLHFNILLLLSYFLYLLYTVNQFSFTHFRYCVTTFSYKHMPQCKFSLYLKKAGLASRNIVHFKKKSHSTLYRSLLSLSSFIFIKPIRSTFDPTYSCRIIVHGCLLGHYEKEKYSASGEEVDSIFFQVEWDLRASYWDIQNKENANLS